MIKLYDGEILDLLPGVIAADTDVQCISYAIKMEFRRILDEADQTRTQAMLDSVSEKILDVLAVELRSPYYLETMDVEVKRNIIQNTLLWYKHAGTPNAVAEMIETIFGEGEVVEWFDFEDGEGEPGTFDIITNAWMSEEILEQFVGIIQRVKNTRSHIRGITIHREYDVEEHAAAGTVTTPHVKVTNSQQEELEKRITGRENAGAGAIAYPRFSITNNPAAVNARTAKTSTRMAAAIICTPKISIA